MKYFLVGFLSVFTLLIAAGEALRYSKKAYDDGYNFSELVDWAQEHTKRLYVSENALSDYALAKERILSSDNRPSLRTADT